MMIWRSKRLAAGSPLLAPADWPPVRAGIMGSNGYVTLTLTDGLAGPQHFYRLLMEE